LSTATDDLPAFHAISASLTSVHAVLKAAYRGDWMSWLRGDWTSWLRGDWMSWLRGDWMSWLRGDWTSWLRGDWTSWLRGDWTSWLRAIPTVADSEIIVMIPNVVASTFLIAPVLSDCVL
jgi:hypothetical protein